MDIAEDMGEGKGARGSRWGIAAGTSPRDGEVLDQWLSLVARDQLSDCILSISFRVPGSTLALFLRFNGDDEHPPTQLA